MLGARVPQTIARDLVMLTFGVALGLVLASGAPEYARGEPAKFSWGDSTNAEDLASIRTSFSAACDEDISFALTHVDPMTRLQASIAISRIRGVKTGTRSFSSGKCYDFMRNPA